MTYQEILERYADFHTGRGIPPEAAAILVLACVESEAAGSLRIFLTTRPPAAPFPAPLPEIKPKKGKAKHGHQQT